MKPKINWALLSSDFMAALTTISLIPYDKDSMQLISSLVPPEWIPFVIKAGIVATLALRLLGRYLPAKTTPTQ